MLPVFILHAAALRFGAAVRLRAIQLAAIGARYLGQYDFLLRAVPQGGAPGPWLEDLRGGIVILSVGVAGDLPRVTAERLRARNRALLCDWIAEAPRGACAELCDLHLFGSLGAFRTAGQRSPGLARAYVTHHADLGLAGCDPAPQDRVRAIWPGDPHALPSALAGRVTGAAPVARLSDLVPHLPGFNLHLVGGPAPPMAPLLPVFAAAACGANVIVSRSRNDAMDYLGQSYPFWTEDESAGAMAAALDRAEAAFGGPDWRRGLERMYNLRDRSSPGMVASDLLEVLERAAALRPEPRAA